MTTDLRWRRLLRDRVRLSDHAAMLDELCARLLAAGYEPTRAQSDRSQVSTLCHGDKYVNLDGARRAASLRLETMNDAFHPDDWARWLDGGAPRRSRSPFAEQASFIVDKWPLAAARARGRHGVDSALREFALEHALLRVPPSRD